MVKTMQITMRSRWLGLREGAGGPVHPQGNAAVVRAGCLPLPAGNYPGAVVLVASPVSSALTEVRDWACHRYSPLPLALPLPAELGLSAQREVQPENGGHKEQHHCGAAKQHTLIRLEAVLSYGVLQLQPYIEAPEPAGGEEAGERTGCLGGWCNG